MRAVLAILVKSGDAPKSEVLLRVLTAVATAAPQELIDDTFFELTPKSKVEFERLNEALTDVVNDFPSQLEYGLFGAIGQGALRP